MPEPRTWAKFQKRHYRAESANHPDKNATIRALSIRWAAVKASRITPRQAAVRAAQQVTGLTAGQLPRTAAGINTTLLAALAGPAIAPILPPVVKQAQPVGQQAQPVVKQAQPAATHNPPENDPPGSPPRVDPLRTRIKFFGDDEGDEVLMAADRNLGPPTADSKWRGGWSILEDKVVLWIRFDQEARVAERRVLKTVQLPRDYWLEPLRWEGDVLDFETRAPMDWALQRRLCTAAGGRDLFNYARACVVDNEAWTYKLYLDYCDEDHVGLLSQRYRFDDDSGLVPEPFCWSILEDLAKAVLVMQQGALDAPRDGWKEIVHRDFKPDNIFLTSKEGSRYPKVQMSDFEHSFETSQDDPFNPKYFREDEVGNEGYYAPEMMQPGQRAALINAGLQLPANLRADLSADKILTAANVWNIGTTMYSIMNIRPENGWIGQEKLAGYDTFRWKNRDPWWSNWDPGLDQRYSTDLIQLVRDCLQDDPLLRPTPARLLQSIRGQAIGLECQRKKNARTATPADIGAHWNDVEEFAFKGVSDSYKIGMTYDQVVAQAGQGGGEEGGGEEGGDDEGGDDEGGDDEGGDDEGGNDDGGDDDYGDSE